MSALFLLQCRSFLDPFEVFKGEIEETIHKIQKAISILKYFRSIYAQYAKHRVAKMFAAAHPQQNTTDTNNSDGEQAATAAWSFPDELVFYKFDAFLQRLHVVKVKR